MATSDRTNRRETKTDGAHSYIFQARAMRRNFGANQSLTTHHIWHIIKTRGKQAGLGTLAPHDLRRTSITKAFQQNTPITAILNMSKHKSVETLMIYNKGLDNLENNAVHSLSYDSEQLQYNFNGSLIGLDSQYFLASIFQISNTSFDEKSRL